MNKSQPLYRLIYASTARTGLREHDIGAIVDTSVNNNNQRFITGFLVFNGTAFLQVLEGPVEEVMEIYSRILNDRRHSGVVQIAGELHIERAFPDCDMHYFRASLTDAVHPRVEPVLGLIPAAAPVWIRDLLSEFSTIV